MLKTIIVITFLFFGAYTVNTQTPQYKIAFNTLQDQKADDYEVYVMNSDGTSEKNITNHKDVAWTYYSLKNKALFVSDRGACRRCYFLHTSNIDGSDVRKVSDLQVEDSWMGSRNGQKQLVVSGRIGSAVRYQLFLIDLENGRYHQLTNEPNAAFRDPSFSPDGKKIIYVYKKNRADRAEIEELYIMNADGSNRKKLTTYPAIDPLAKGFDYKVGPPHWNAKYKFITYQSNQAGKQSIYAVTPDGKKQWKLTDSKLDEGWHDWSPDGEWLVFDSRDEATGRYDLYLMNYKTKETKKITGDSPLKYHQSPVFIDTK